MTKLPLGVLCVPSIKLRTCFARVIFFPILRGKIQPKISFMFGYFFSSTFTAREAEWIGTVASRKE